MPELPEVEGTARALRAGDRLTGTPPLAGRRIVETRVLRPSQVEGRSPEGFVRLTTGREVKGIGRYGKYLVVELEPAEGAPRFMVVHLRMTGRLKVVPVAEAFTTHARVVWLLDNGMALRFEDPRAFGRVGLVADPSVLTAGMGPDALGIGEGDFIARLPLSRRAIKPVLLDQAFLAGIGNIYADEALFRACIHPERPASSLSREEALRLHQAVVAILAEAVESGGANIKMVFSPGGYRTQVFARHGTPCPSCGGTIHKTRVGGRGTHFCPCCQPSP